MRVLVVEDNPINSRLFCAWLRDAGYTATPVESGAQARERLAQAPFDLIIMDIALPGETGLVASAGIRADAATCALPILCVSAFLQSSDTASGACDAYLQKPVGRDTFLRAVVGLLVQRAEIAAGEANKSEEV